MEWDVGWEAGCESILMEWDEGWEAGCDCVLMEWDVGWGVSELVGRCCTVCLTCGGHVQISQTPKLQTLFIFKGGLLKTSLILTLL